MLTVLTMLTMLIRPCEYPIPDKVPTASVDIDPIPTSQLTSSHPQPPQPWSWQSLCDTYNLSEGSFLRGYREVVQTALDECDAKPLVLHEALAAIDDALQAHTADGLGTLTQQVQIACRWHGRQCRAAVSDVYAALGASDTLDRFIDHDEADRRLEVKDRQGANDTSPNGDAEAHRGRMLEAFRVYCDEASLGPGGGKEGAERVEPWFQA